MGNALAINTEIERRFLVDGRDEKPWRNTADIRQITQYYLDSSDIEIHELTIDYRGVPLVSISPEEGFLSATISRSAFFKVLISTS